MNFPSCTSIYILGGILKESEGILSLCKALKTLI